jgi:hypothetical protein
MGDPRASTTAPAPRPRGLLGETLLVFARGLPALFGLGALATLPFALATWWRGAPDGHGLLFALAAGTLHLALSACAIGAALHGLAGRPCRHGRMLSRALRRLPSMLVAATLGGLAVFGILTLGLLAARHVGPLALPVVIATFVVAVSLATALRVSVAVAFVEGRSGTASMARSLALTRGRRLRIFGAQTILGLLLSPLAHLFDDSVPGTTARLLGDLALGGISGALGAAFTAVTYAHLRKRRDGHENAAIVDEL